MPRPKKKLPRKVDGRDVYELLADWPEQGVALADCSARCSMSPGTFREILGRPAKDGTPTVEPRDKRASDAWQVGHGRRITWLWGEIHRARNPTPCIYELKSKYGFTDMPKPEPTALDSLVKIGKLILPAPMTRDEWTKRIAPAVEVEAEVVEEVARA